MKTNGTQCTLGSMFLRELSQGEDGKAGLLGSLSVQKYAASQAGRSCRTKDGKDI